MAVSSQLLRHTTSVSRMADIGGGKRGVQPLNSGIACLFLPDEDNKLTVTPRIGQPYTCYLNQNEDIEPTDVLTDQDGNDYTVTGVEEYPQVGAVAHKAVNCVRE